MLRERPADAVGIKSVSLRRRKAHGKETGPWQARMLLEDGTTIQRSTGQTSRRLADQTVKKWRSESPADDGREPDTGRIPKPKLSALPTRKAKKAPVTGSYKPILPISRATPGEWKPPKKGRKPAQAKPPATLDAPKGPPRPAKEVDLERALDAYDEKHGWIPDRQWQAFYLEHGKWPSSQERVEEWAERRGHRRKLHKPTFALVLLVYTLSVVASALGMVVLLPLAPLGWGIAFAAFLALVAITTHGGWVLSYRPRLAFAIGLLASLGSIYTSFAGSYRFLGGTENDRNSAQSLAVAAHAAVVSNCVSPTRRRAHAAQGAAKSLFDQSEREASSGQLSGRGRGHGPKARELAAKAAAEQVEATGLFAMLESLGGADRLEASDDAFAAHKKAVALHSQMGCAGDPPSMAQFQHAGALVPFVAPAWKLTQGDPFAIGAAVMALLIDGIGMVLLLGIVRRGQHRKIGAARRTQEANAASVRARQLTEKHA